MGVIGEGDEELVGVGGDAKGEGVHPGELVVAGSDFSFGFHPGWLGVGGLSGLRGHRSVPQRCQRICLASSGTEAFAWWGTMRGV